ncbi:MAG TPA: anti-sigma factor [Terriglobales bacterium]|nr:anti-sigma factor [Terriglobales bacterium]
MSDPWSVKLEPYLDGELSPEDMRDLDSHLRTCPACAAEVLRHLQMKRAVRAAGRQFSPSPEFKRRVQQQIAPRRPAAAAWRWAVPVLAVLLIALSIYLGRQRSQAQHASSELADLHVTTLASTTPVDVVSSDRHTVKPWFQGKIPFTFNLPELQNTEFTLLGGRIAYFNQASGAHLIYQVRKHEISVFIFPERDLNALGTGKTLSFNSASWSEGGLSYFVIGDAASDDIQKLAALLQNAAKN